MNYVANAEAVIEETKTTGRHAQERRIIRQRIPSEGDTRKKSRTGLGFTGVEKPKTDKDQLADGLTSGEYPRRSAGTASPHKGATALPPGDVSTLHPIPSSTRRRTKEYFQRRTRERSADPVGRHAGPPRRCATREIKSSVQVPRSQLDLKGGAIVSASAKSPSTDQFVFDPEADPFTPNATSSPRQASLSSIGVQSFSSPTPLPSHGNRKVVPLVLPETSNRVVETRRDSVPQLIPVTTHGITHTYTYAGTQAHHVQAEQIAQMRLQAYYNWLAGTSVPRTGVGVGVQTCEHMDMSGGGGGLSGGVALGRHAQIQGRGKSQCRNASGAYAHPKEHVVFSPRDHEQRTSGGSQSALPLDRGVGIVEPGKGESEKDEKEPEEEARGQMWDGKWGLRDASGKEIGWSWGLGE